MGLNFYGMFDEFPEWYINVIIIGNIDVKIISKKLSKKFRAHGTFCPLSDGRSYLKIDVTKKWVFCLIKGVFEIRLLR